MIINDLLNLLQFVALALILLGNVDQFSDKSSCLLRTKWDSHKRAEPDVEMVWNQITVFTLEMRHWNFDGNRCNPITGMRSGGPETRSGRILQFERFHRVKGYPLMTSASFDARSAFSQVNSGSSRPKCP